MKADDCKVTAMASVGSYVWTCGLTGVVQSWIPGQPPHLMGVTRFQPVVSGGRIRASTLLSKKDAMSSGNAITSLLAVPDPEKGLVVCGVTKKHLVVWNSQVLVLRMGYWRRC